MKILMLLMMTISYSVVSHAGYDDMALDASIEAETAFSGSEEARIEAEELKRMAREEKKRKEALHAASIKSAKDAKDLERISKVEAEKSRQEKIVIGRQVKEIQKNLKATEARKADAQKRINRSKAEVANYNKSLNEYKAKKEASNKELMMLQTEAATFQKYVQDALQASIRAQKEAYSMQKQVKDTQASTDRARVDAQKRVERYKEREAHYQAMAEKNKSGSTRAPASTGR